MKFNTQVCTTREQSERLLAMGIKPETADMVRQAIGATEYKVWHKSKVEDDFFPAWSLHRLWVINNDIYCELSLSDTFDCMIDEIEDKVRHRLINKEYLMK